MRKILNKIQTLILLLLAAGAPVVAVLGEQFWFQKRIGLAAAAVVLLALLAARVWRIGRISPIGPINKSLGWLLFAASLTVAVVVPAGRVANLMAPDLWAAIGAILAYFAIKNILTSSRAVKLGFFGILVGLGLAAVLVAVGIGRIGPIGPIVETLHATSLQMQRSPIFGEFREFRAARLGVLQTANGLGILGILGILALVYQLGLKSVKEIFKSSSIWWKLLNILVLILLAAFLILPHPALTLWPLAVAAALSRGIARKVETQHAASLQKIAWAIFVGLSVVTIVGSTYGMGRVVWGELKFREALAAANRNEGIATYNALLETIKRNPYEVRYRLLASQIDIALANSIAAQAVETPRRGVSTEDEATESAEPRLTAQDRNNILILIQQAVVQGKAAIKLDPQNSGLWQNLASIYRSLIGVAGGAENWALKSYQRAEELNPTDPNAPLQLGTIHFISGNFLEASEAFERAAEMKSDWALAHYNLGVVYNAMGEVDKAIEQLRETLALLPTDDPSREQVEKDLAFLKGEKTPTEVETGHAPSLQENLEATPSAELKEATTSAEVQAPPPPVGPEATESAGPIEVELGED